MMPRRFTPASFSQQFRFLIRALRYRNFRLFFVGQFLSLIGTWMQFAALGWLVFRLTGSEQMLGVVAFARQIPIFLLTPFTGVLADRWNRHRTFVATQVLSMLQAFALAGLTLTHRIDETSIIVLSVLLGLVNSVDMPVRQALVVNMIDDRNDLANALALNSSIMNGGRLVGPVVAGAMISLFNNEGVCFLLNGVSFLAVIIALLFMRMGPAAHGRPQTRMWSGLWEGLKYVSAAGHIRALLMVLALVSLFGFPYSVLMPTFAKEVLGRGPVAFGLLNGGVGIGALIGFFYLASRRSPWGLERVIPIATVIFSLGLMAFSLSRSLYLSLVLTLATGFGMMVQNVSINTVLQSIVDEDKRGRVMALFTMSLIGMAPFGNLVISTAASYMGTPRACFLGGLICLLGGCLFWLKLPRLVLTMHPIYESKGIRPDTSIEKGTIP